MLALFLALVAVVGISVPINNLRCSHSTVFSTGKVVSIYAVSHSHQTLPTNLLIYFIHKEMKR